MSTRTGTRRAQDAFAEAERRYLGCYDVDVTMRFVDIEEPATRLRVAESGDGPPLLLLHGAGVFALQWLPLFPHLQDFKLIAPDMPGRGLSDRFHYRGVDVRSHGARVIEGLLDALDIEQLAVAASSLGAYRALALAHRFPGRVTALCLFGCPAPMLDNTKAPAGARLMSLPGVGRIAVALSTEKQERSMWQTFGGDAAAAALPDAFVTYSHREGKLPGSAKAISTVLQKVFTPRGYSRSLAWTETELGQITTPTLLLWGRDDVFGDLDLARRVVAAMPDATLEPFDGGHFPWFEEPERCAELVRDFVSTIIR